MFYAADPVQAPAPHDPHRLPGESPERREQRPTLSTTGCAHPPPKEEIKLFQQRRKLTDLNLGAGR